MKARPIIKRNLMKARILKKRIDILEAKYLNGFLTYFVKNGKVFFTHKNTHNIVKPSMFTLNQYKNKVKDFPHLWKKL